MTRDTSSSPESSEEARSLLILRYLDGLTSAEESERLIAALAADPALRDLFVALSTQQGQLAEIVAPQAQAARVETSGNEKSIRFPARRPLHRRTPAWAIPLAAAALVLACIGGFSLLQSPPAVSIGSIQSVAGSVSITRAGLAHNARVGDPIFSKDRVEAAAHSRTTILLAGETTSLALSQSAQLRLQFGPSGKHLELTAGRLEAIVATQPQGVPMTVTTPAGRIQVVGTHFVAVAEPETTRARVIDGRIRMTRATDGREVEIPAGSYAVANASRGSFPLAPFKPGEWVEGRVIFQDDFEQGLGHWILGTTGPLPTATPQGETMAFIPGGPSQHAQRVSVSRDGRQTHCVELQRERDGKESTLHSNRDDLPEAFRFEFDVLHCVPSSTRLFEFTNRTGSKTVFTHPEYKAMQVSRMKAQEWWRIRVDWIPSQPEEEDNVVHLKQYFDNLLVQHTKNTDSRPLPMRVGCLSGRIRVDNIVLTELVSFE